MYCIKLQLVHSDSATPYHRDNGAIMLGYSNGRVPLRIRRRPTTAIMVPPPSVASFRPPTVLTVTVLTGHCTHCTL